MNIKDLANIPGLGHPPNPTKEEGERFSRKVDEITRFDQLQRWEKSGHVSHPKIYAVIGAYFGNGGDVEKNLAEARNVLKAVWELGHVAFSLPNNTGMFHRDFPQLDEDGFIAGYQHAIAHLNFDGVVCCGNWNKSRGTMQELMIARERGRELYFYPDQLPPPVPEEWRFQKLLSLPWSD